MKDAIGGIDDAAPTLLRVFGDLFGNNGNASCSGRMQNDLERT
jgi:hypothetical protein